VIHVVPVTHRDLIVIIWSCLQQRLIRDGAAPVGKKGGAAKDEHQITPPVRRDFDIDLGVSQLDRAFIVEGTILAHAMDVNSRTDA
jgi:hypothetical protein